MCYSCLAARLKITAKKDGVVCGTPYCHSVRTNVLTPFPLNKRPPPYVAGRYRHRYAARILRNTLGLTGTRFGCGLEQCGACMVLVNGKPVQSCNRALDSVAGRDITTIEGLTGADGGQHPLQQAFLDEQAGQCGYCLSGILISAKALLDRNPNPTREEIAAALDNNLCRCGSHIQSWQR